MKAYFRLSRRIARGTSVGVSVPVDIHAPRSPASVLFLLALAAAVGALLGLVLYIS